MSSEHCARFEFVGAALPRRCGVGVGHAPAADSKHVPQERGRKRAPATIVARPHHGGKPKRRFEHKRTHHFALVRLKACVSSVSKACGPYDVRALRARITIMGVARLRRSAWRARVRLWTIPRRISCSCWWTTRARTRCTSSSSRGTKRRTGWSSSSTPRRKWVRFFLFLLYLNFLFLFFWYY